MNITRLTNVEMRREMVMAYDEPRIPVNVWGFDAQQR